MRTNRPKFGRINDFHDTCKALRKLGKLTYEQVINYYEIKDEATRKTISKQE